MNITHPYSGIGWEYLKTRKGNLKFAEFMITHANLRNGNNPLKIVELGIGSGQQTELVEKELFNAGYFDYLIYGFDKSYKNNSNGNPGQLNILLERINSKEISERVIPFYSDFDKNKLPLESGTADLVYMANVFHHLANKEQALNEISRILKPDAAFFNFGVTIEDLEHHPLDEFFPEKFEYDKTRYPTEEQLKKMFHSVGLSYEEHFRTGKGHVRLINRDFLASAENTTLDSVLMMIQENDPAAFDRGIQMIRNEVEIAERTGEYREYFTSVARVFWGIKKINI